MASLASGELPPRAFPPLSTGFRLFLILSLALLPLGLVAFFATLQSNRTADEERQSQMRVALSESVRLLNGAFASDIVTFRNAMNILAERDDPGLCARLTSIMASQGAEMPRFALFGVGSAPLCASPGFAPTRPVALALSESGRPGVTLSERGVEMTLPATSGSAVTTLLYERTALGAMGAPGGFAVPYSLTLVGGGATIEIVDRVDVSGLSGFHAIEEPLGLGGIAVELRAAREPFSAADIVALMLPLLMWLAAAVIGWLVVDRVLIKPLRRLESAVARYTPGEVIDTPGSASGAASELDQLGASFSGLTRTVASHEAQLAESLQHQVKLTREVHHRVKNNLQVIASLISLHARGQTSDAVVRAYASIQRRVDALAVVLRQHHAEFEVSKGVNLRALIGELAQNFRGAQLEGEPAPAISLDLCPCYTHQDVAVPIAFLLTELIELSQLGAPGEAIAIELREREGGKARLAVRSPGLRGDKPPERFARVLEGLSRQLRAPLEKDPELGIFAIIVTASVELIEDDENDA